MNNTKPFVSRLLKLWLCGLFVLAGNSSFATHSAGSDISYRCLGGLLYEIEVTFYRDCGGVGEPSNITINCRSVNGNHNLTLTAMKMPGFGNEITVPCTGMPTNCNGGSGTGIRQWKYSAQVLLPSPQPDWIFSYSICCRNCSITTISNPCAATSVLYVEATLNNLDGYCNNSPVFTNIPVAYVCLGQNYNYNHGVTDADGDSLVYTLITPKTTALTDVTFIPPYSAASPVASSTPFILDPVNGDLNFTPSQIQIGILALNVSEFRNGELIGSVTRDMQVYISPCSNTLPELSGINGSSDYTIDACPGSPVCFTVNSSDIDSSQTVTISSNEGIPDAVYTISNGNRPSLDFCWTPSYADAGKIRTFTVTVRDNACPVNGLQVFAYHVRVYNKVKISSFPSNCNSNTGSVSVLNPLPGSQYLWSNGATGTTISQLPPAGYSVIITQPAGCTMTDTVAVNESDLILINSGSDQTCANTCTGGIILQPDGGTEPYQYNWQNGGNASQLSGLCAGDYSVTVTDVNGCVADSSFIISSMSPVNLQFQIRNTVCDKKGFIQAIVSGNSVPYQYLWSNGQTTSLIDELVPGIYMLTVTDSAGCDATGTAEVISIVDTLNIISVIQGISCPGSEDGSVSLNISGGTLPYEYNWSDGANTPSISDLSPGNFSVTITDSNGCTGSTSVIISDLNPFSLNASVTQADCRPGSGAIHPDMTGGTPPYTFLWNNGITLPGIENLNPGIYSVTVTDDKGCQFTDSVNLSGINTFNAYVNVTNVNCQGEANGSIMIQPSGGTPPFIYQWSDGDTSSARHGLIAGIYKVNITDATGCRQIISASVEQPSGLSIIQNVVPPECITNTPGSLTLIPSGGNPPYSCNWTDSTQGFSRNKINAGTYHFTIMDSAGCIFSDSVSLTGAGTLNIHVQPSPEICMGDKAQLSISSPPEGAIITWFYNGMILKGANSPVFETPVAGIYKAGISAPCGEFFSDEIEIKVKLVESVSISNNQLICPGEKAELNVSGGIRYLWSPADGVSDSLSSQVTVSPSETTTYKVTVTGMNGCTTIATTEVAVVCDPEIPNGFSPNHDGINDYFVITGFEDYPEITIYVYNRWGNLVFRQQEYDNRWDGRSNVGGALMGEDLPDGTYYYILDLHNNRKPATGYVVIRR
jgi:gliding motility-associated-like protein